MNEMIMVSHSLNSNTPTGLVKSLCLNTDPLVSLLDQCSWIKLLQDSEEDYWLLVNY